MAVMLAVITLLYVVQDARYTVIPVDQAGPVVVQAYVPGPIYGKSVSGAGIWPRLP